MGTRADSYQSLLKHCRVTVTDSTLYKERAEEEENCFKVELNEYMTTIVSQNSQNAFKKYKNTFSANILDMLGQWLSTLTKKCDFDLFDLHKQCRI